jgi:hypothetical protein
MASQKNLALLLPAQVASMVGWEVQSLTSTGTTQGSTGGVIKGKGNRIVKGTSHAANGAFTLPADAAEGDEIIVVGSGNTFDVFPPSGHNFIGLADNAQANSADNGSISCIYLGSTIWLARIVAVPT